MALNGIVCVVYSDINWIPLSITIALSANHIRETIMTLCYLIIDFVVSDILDTKSSNQLFNVKDRLYDFRELQDSTSV